MKNSKNKLINVLKSVFILGVFALSLSALASWNAPTATPPGNNTDAPINTSVTAQQKAGGLWLGGLFVNGHADFNNSITTVGGVGIGTGTVEPTAKLEVVGQVKITGGTPALNKVLASDANGLASWKSLTELGGGGGGGGSTSDIWTHDGTLIRPITMTDDVWIGYDSIIYKSGNSANSNVSKFIHTTGAPSNTFVGRVAGDSTSISGAHNTGIGYAALESIGGGENNTGLGSNALKITTSGANNTAVGVDALLNNTTGSNNTALGNSSGITSGSLSNTTAIGAGANVDLSNKIKLGNSAVTWIGGQVGWSAVSDVRLKKNIKNLDLGLDFINKLRPVSYQMKTDTGNDENFGFIAQDVEKVLDGRKAKLIGTDNTPEAYKNMRYDDLIAPMVKAIQEQQKEIEDLKAEIEILKRK